MVTGDMAPETVLRAALEVVYFAAVTTRNWTYNDDVSRQQISDLWDAIHNVPILLRDWQEDSEAELLSYLGGYDQKWPSPRLRAFYKRALADMRHRDDSEALRRQRWNDFERRVQFSPNDVYRHRTHGWEYIPSTLSQMSPRFSPGSG
jgi:hypothetical protein